MELLNVKSVDKSYGGVIANHDVSLKVPKGKIVGIIGPNGSGKTTLFNSIVGHHPIDSGEIHFNGKEISSLTIPFTFMSVVVAVCADTELNATAAIIKNPIIKC